MEKISYKEIIEIEKEMEVVSAVKMGGYYKWNLKFPFRHWVDEELLIATKNKIYKLEKGINQ